MVNFEDLPSVQSCRRIDFDKAEIIGTGLPGSKLKILFVSGNKPWMNMEVKLMPLIYVRQPEYWGIEVVGFFQEVGIPALTPYTVCLPLAGIIGTKGIEVIGANKSEKIQVYIKSNNDK